MKKIGKIAIIGLAFLMIGCSNGNKESQNAENVSDSSNAETMEANSSKANEEEFKAETPVLLTSVGQSADVEMVKSMLGKTDIEFTDNNLATEADLGDAKTLILAVGGSSKGLGAAGIDADEEIKRVSALIDAAKSNGVKIIAIHIGGEARRGELSDKFIKPSFENADYAIVVESGDSDNMMRDIAKDNGYKIDIISQMTDTITKLEEVF